MSNKDPFITLSKVGANLPLHVLNILQQVGYNSFRGISQIDTAKLRRIELHVQANMASDSNLADMTEEEKKKTFGPVHWKNPKLFTFLVGEEDEITAAASIAGKYVTEFDHNNQVSYPMGGKRRKLSQQPVSSSTMYNCDVSVAGSSTNNHSSVSIQTPKKKLLDYLSSWLANTSVETTYSAEDYEVDEDLNQVKCKHCPAVKMQIYIRSGNWKANSFQNHVKNVHASGIHS